MSLKPPGRAPAFLALGLVVFLFGLLAAAASPLRFSKHARQRMKERGVSEQTVRQIVKTVPPFTYRHEGSEKLGYYDAPRRIFVASTTRGLIITVIADVTPDYVERLRDKGP